MFHEGERDLRKMKGSHKDQESDLGSDADLHSERNRRRRNKKAQACQPSMASQFGH